MTRVVLALCALLASAPVALAQETSSSLTAQSLERELAAAPTGPAATRLADRVREWFGGRDALLAGAAPKVEGTTVAWAAEVAAPPDAVLTVGSDGVHFTRRLTRIGDSGVFAAVATLAHGDAFSWHFLSGTRRFGGGQLEVYDVHADSVEQAGVARGITTQQPAFKSRIFEGTTRDWWVYVPAKAAGSSPAAVMVFQDGAGVRTWVPTVFDNLIARGEMPPTVGIFINPGAFADGRSNRSAEYDALSDRYARFLLDEILPEVSRQVPLRTDAAGRAIVGASSGGICAFTVAWERPDQFSKVVSWIGSFTNIASGASLREGGHNYQALLRKTARKPIRVFLQDGANDLDNVHGSWPLANLSLAGSLAWAGYDYRFEYGKGFHSNRHGRAILPDTLRWLWRDWKSTQP
ncbi:MAG TPA: alpha/beta hydrolase-fold protein [Luteitalea sp.]|nr:alpha/beta hydrolase-fold protein [Luteitalea sp.]